MSASPQDLRSLNFVFLAAHSARFVRLGALAERMLLEGLSTTLVKLRQFGELMAHQLAARAGMLGPPEKPQVDRLWRLQDRKVFRRAAAGLFHQLRKASNAAFHAFGGSHQQAREIMRKEKPECIRHN